MADEVKMKRNSTMDVTVKEGNEFITRAVGAEENNSSEKSPAKPARQSTMETTAKEGIEYLKNSRQDTLLEMQGLTAPRSTTAADDDESEETDSDSSGDVANGTAKLAKNTTMVATAEEAAGVMEALGGSPDKDAKTRGQQKQLEKLMCDSTSASNDNDTEPEVKRPRRENTMVKTAKEAAQLIGDEQLGDSRSSTHAAKKAENEEVSPTPVKTRSMTETLKESERILGSKQK